jgi:hypothetical protein
MAAEGHVRDGTPCAAVQWPHADDMSVIQGPNCQSIQWGLLEQRTVCDTPVQADGSWRRKRTV